jgi:hypothetical protein
MLAFVLLLMTAPVAAQQVEKELILTISGPELKGGIISEVTWDGGILLMQGVFAEPTGELKSQYFLVPAESTRVEQRTTQSDESLRYWRLKSNRLSPTGLGRIDVKSDTKMPQFGVGSLERRLGEAVEMGGTQTTTELRLGTLLLHSRAGDAPYDGEVWSWSPAELNRIAYVDEKGDLWVARADGRDPRRILKGNFTLPAWSEDGRQIAIAERKANGTRWEISVVHLPADLTRNQF